MMPGKCPACGERGLSCDRSEDCLNCGYGRMRESQPERPEPQASPQTPQVQQAPPTEPLDAFLGEVKASLVDDPVARAAFDAWWESRGGPIAEKPDGPEDEEAWDQFHLMYGFAWLAFIAGWRAKPAP